MKKVKKILLVDDDRANNYINEQLLKNLHIAESIHVETNGEKALAHLLTNCETHAAHGICPELVILDHHMPVMDGLELMHILNERGFIDKHAIVFILLGINSTKEHIAEFQKLGIQEYTQKPLSEQKVMDAYHKYFAGDTARDHNK
jgi:CheY-like chemotaxis protein